MFARITRYKMKPGTRDAATTVLNGLKDQIMAMNGIVHFMNAANEDGTGYVVAVLESREASEANQDKVRAVWQNFAEFLEEMPTPEGFDVIADWS